MTIPEFQSLILAWYKKNRRSMPWRDIKDPYKILVSEVMLQQTQVARVLPKYKEFLAEFPTILSLAQAKDGKLLKTWRGLGYWKRALSLKKAAREIVYAHKGKFPETPHELERLPGIGPYTARAVCCFAFQNTEAFLDTNIRKVYLHFFFPKRRNVSDKEILKVAQQTLWYKNPREWHYALFDYGAIMLKSKSISKRSKHYAKQSRFEGSFRSFRTKVMRFLLDQPRQAATTGKIQRLLKKNCSSFASERILASLEKDGLIKKKKGLYSL